MPSSSVCQGFQSCMEPWLIEPQILRLKLTPPGSLSLPEAQENSSTKDEISTKMDKNADMGGWSFLLSLKKTEDPQAQKVYVHPAVKHSSSMLTGKSLEMCTESLGCETGSDNASDNMDEFAFLSSENSTACFSRHVSEACRSDSVSSSRMKRSRSFPPPLTSLTDLGGVQVRPHREDGRLILEAVATPSVQPCFQAQRINGRLTLTMFQTFLSDDEVSDDEAAADDDEGEEEEEEEEEEEGVVVADDDDEDSDVEELEGINEIVDDEIGKRKLARPRRCKESGNRNKNAMPNWEPFWVAT
ncbi:protein FANTASTIC FOUR 1-like [Prosopis cineraria]|uniref:protein FANTASTIC FOUR 1-like n=1 Tax=Prosopis cineraria TaxID=364024 RepID=UPI00240EF32D|nr:protein FANTASTIC FOUR 1-like [Prosopis cineraria]